MFYIIDDTVREIPFGEICPGKPVVGYIDAGELKEIGERLGFSRSVTEACSVENGMFSTDVEIHQDYTYTQMHIVYRDASDDCISLLIKRDLLLVVKVCDADNSVAENLASALRRVPVSKLNLTRITCMFIESFISGDKTEVELLRNELNEKEESVIKGEPGDDFNIRLLDLKKRLLRLHNYYEQLLDIAETIEDNENEIFEESQLMYATNLKNKVIRLRESIDSLRSSSDHLQDAYSSALDMKMNRSMKIFTVITSVFFPLTIIGGWYGMNFTAMPELSWKYGYLYVTALSAAAVSGLYVLCKKKKWF